MFPKTLSAVRRAVDNERALQDLLMQATPRYVTALKRERASEAQQELSGGAADQLCG